MLYEWMHDHIKIIFLEKGCNAKWD